MIQSGQLDKSQVAKAVQEQIDRMPQGEQKVFSLRVIDDNVRWDEGWIVPVRCDASLAVEKSYELHRRLEQIQDDAEKALNTLITITIDY